MLDVRAMMSVSTLRLALTRVVSILAHLTGVPPQLNVFLKTMLPPAGVHLDTQAIHTQFVCQVRLAS